MLFVHPDAPRLRFHYLCADSEVHEEFRLALELAEYVFLVTGADARLMIYSDDDDEVNEQLHVRILQW